MTNVPAGKATIETGVHDKTAKGVQAIKNRFKKMSASISAMSKKAALASASIGAPLALAAKNFVSVGDSLNKASTRTRIQVAELAKLRFAAAQSDVSIKGLEDAIFRMDRRVGNAVTGLGPAKRALHELGIEANQFSLLDPDKKFELLIGSLNGVTNESLRAQLGFELFGDNFRELVPLIDGGVGSLNELKQKAVDAGVAFTGMNADKQAANAAKLSDSFNILKNQVSAVAINVGNSLAPMILKAAKSIQPFMKRVIEFIKANPDLVTGLGKTAVALGTVAVATKAVSVAMAANPFGLMVIGITAAIAALPELRRQLGLTKKELNGIGGRYGVKEKDLFRGKSNGNEMQRIREHLTRENERMFKSGEIDKKEYERVLGRLDADSKPKKSAAEIAKARAESDKKSSAAYKRLTSGITRSILAAAKQAGESIKAGRDIAGHAALAGMNFLQAQTIQPQLLSSTAGGFGGGALGLGATNGAGNPMQEMVDFQGIANEHLAEMRVGIDSMVNNGIEVSQLITSANRATRNDIRIT